MSVFSRQRGGSRGVALQSIGALVAVVLLVAASLHALHVHGSAPRQVADASDYISADLADNPQGVDASKWQHPSADSIDWKEAAAGGKSFAFIKATDGTELGNEYFESDFKAARDAGLKVGAYHKAHPAMDPVAQADAFSDAVISMGGQQLPPVLDFELDEGLDTAALSAWVRKFMDRTKEKTGRTPIMYTYKYFWLSQMSNTDEFSEYPLWLAEYHQDEPTQPDLGGWKSWTFWQYAGDDGVADGFDTAVDLNVFKGSTAELDAMVGPVGSGASDTPAPSTGGGTSDGGNESGAGTGNDSGTGTESGAESGNESGTGTHSGGTTAAPRTLTIPKLPVPAGVLPKGITLPLTIVLPSSLSGSGSGSGSGGSAGKAGSSGASSDLEWLSELLGGLPSEVLKSISIK